MSRDPREGLLVLRPDDDVGIARSDLPGGIPAGHKVAVRAVAAGSPVHKYGEVIGVASVDIAPGDHVHTHNLSMPATHGDHGSSGVRVVPRVEPVPVEDQVTFEGIVRADGAVATRNYVGVLTTVNCSATTARRIADEVSRSGVLDDFPHVDGILALTHGTGCGMAADGPGLELLRRTISGYAQHPNIGAVLVVGLGCEVNEIGALTRDLPTATPLTGLTIQELGGTRRTTAHGVGLVQDLLPDLDRARREPVPVSRLVLGLNCGGSDGWSGVTANPALGLAVDRLVEQGGTAVLAETPEIYGAEHLLTGRCVAESVAERLLERIRWWERYTAATGATMDNNPSPGNKAGGLTTILEKSLGAVAKAGHTPLAEVVEYAERVHGPGLVFMDTPGYDPVSVTGIVAGGAHVVCFTTGRGSAFGAKPVPSLKLATNSEVFHRMRDDMDVDCGVVLDGDRSLEDVGREVFDRVVAVASGELTASEELGYGDEEFAPWQLGAVM